MRSKKKKSPEECIKEYEDAAIESINQNPEKLKLKTMDIVLTKITTLEKTVGELHSHIMPDTNRDWPGIFIAITALTKNVDKLEKMQESEIKKSSSRDEDIGNVKDSMKKLKDEVSEIKTSIKIKEAQETAIKNDHDKRSKSFELRHKWIAAIATGIAILSWLKEYILS